MSSEVRFGQPSPRVGGGVVGRAIDQVLAVSTIRTGIASDDDELRAGPGRTQRASRAEGRGGCLVPLFGRDVIDGAVTVGRSRLAPTAPDEEEVVAPGGCRLTTTLQRARCHGRPLPRLRIEHRAPVAVAVRPVLADLPGPVRDLVTDQGRSRSQALIHCHRRCGQLGPSGR